MNRNANRWLEQVKKLAPCRCKEFLMSKYGFRTMYTKAADGDRITCPNCCKKWVCVFQNREPKWKIEVNNEI